MTDRLQEGKSFDIADGASDFDYTDFGLILLERKTHQPFDLIGDVRDDLDRFPEKCPRPFFAEHIPIDLSGGEVVSGGELLVEEPFVTPDIEVSFTTVARDEYLAVLVGVHRTGVDVEVRIDLLERNAIALELE